MKITSSISASSILLNPKLSLLPYKYKSKTLRYLYVYKFSSYYNIKHAK